MNRAATAAMATAVFTLTFATGWFAYPAVSAMVRHGGERAGAASFLAGAEDRDDELTLTAANIMGKKVPPDLLKAAKDDAPSVDGQSFVATTQFRGVSKFCISTREEGETSHSYISYGRGEFESASSDATGEWVLIGCAEAIRKSGSLLGRQQLAIAMLDLIPDTPKFADDRAQVRDMIAALPP